MFIVISENDLTEEKEAYLFDTKDDAVKYMLEDFKNTRRETFDNEEEIYSRGISDCNTHAFIETEIAEYRWDIIEVLNK